MILIAIFDRSIQIIVEVHILCPSWSQVLGQARLGWASLGQARLIVRLCYDRLGVVLGWARLGQVQGQVKCQVGLGQARQGQARLGQARLVQDRLGVVLGQAGLGQVRLGWARLGKAGLGQVRFVQARLGQFRCYTGLGQFGQDQARLGWTRLGQAMLGWLGQVLGQVRFGVRLGQVGLDWARLGYVTVLPSEPSGVVSQPLGFRSICIFLEVYCGNSYTPVLIIPRVKQVLHVVEVLTFVVAHDRYKQIVTAIVLKT